MEFLIVLFILLVLAGIVWLFLAYERSTMPRTIRKERKASMREGFKDTDQFALDFDIEFCVVHGRATRIDPHSRLSFSRTVAAANHDLGILEDIEKTLDASTKNYNPYTTFHPPKQWEAMRAKTKLFEQDHFWELVVDLNTAIMEAFVTAYPAVQGERTNSPLTATVTLARRTHFVTSELRERITAITRELSERGIPFTDPTNRLNDQVPRQILFQEPIPHNLRFEHMHVVASPGSGKSTLFTHLINHDLDAVARGEATVVVMESTRQLVTSLARLARFAPGGDLHGKLLIIDAEDVEHPLALNLFNANPTDRTLSARDREAAYNATVSMLDYVFRSLLGAELTSRMSTLLNFTINLLLKVPGATIDTIIDIMQPNGIDRYHEALTQCDSDTQLFFRVRFNEAGEMQRTKSHVVERLFAIKRIPAIARLFSSPDTKLNLFDEMNQGRVILINADKDVLQEEGVEIYSRFFLALILMAAQKRTLLPQSERLATFVYIDEAQDVIRRDEKLPILLDQARKFRVGMILAHQHLSQGFLPPVLSALYSSTAIKFAARLSDSDANTLARNMACDAQALVHTPPFHMMLFARGITHTAQLFKIPDVSFDRMPKMSTADYETIREELRARYTTQPTQPTPNRPPPSDPTKASEW